LDLPINYHLPDKEFRLSSNIPIADSKVIILKRAKFFQLRDFIHFRTFQLVLRCKEKVAEAAYGARNEFEYPER
jgi:hypothetical protein